MSKKINVKVNGNSYEVAVGDMNVNPVSVSVNGKEYQIEISEAGGSATPQIAAAPVSAPVMKTTAAAATPAEPVANAVTAPMPGTILDITVKAGDTVTQGQIICALEAMKMKNMIRAPKAGTIASVDVTAGQKVGFGAVIIRYA